MRVTRLRGARTHNLRGLDLDFEPGTLVAIAGPSGAGKSSLAFGTLYAEGQRRYVESFSAYARQFLERLARPPVDELDPVPAGIAVDRQAPVRTSRSTVGTMTEIADYAKSLWARGAELWCPGCGRVVTRDDPQASAGRIVQEARDARVVVTYPVAVSDAEHFLGVREALLADGYRRLWLDGEARDLDTIPPSEILGQDPTSSPGGRPGTPNRAKRAGAERGGWGDSGARAAREAKEAPRGGGARGRPKGARRGGGGGSSPMGGLGGLRPPAGGWGGPPPPPTRSKPPNSIKHPPNSKSSPTGPLRAPAIARGSSRRSSRRCARGRGGAR